jgi:hypothetical protein
MVPPPVSSSATNLNFFVAAALCKTATGSAGPSPRQCSPPPTFSPLTTVGPQCGAIENSGYLKGLGIVVAFVLIVYMCCFFFSRTLQAAVTPATLASPSDMLTPLQTKDEDPEKEKKTVFTPSDPDYHPGPEKAEPESIIKRFGRPTGDERGESPGRGRSPSPGRGGQRV